MPRPSRLCAQAIENPDDPWAQLTARLRALGSRARAEKEKSYQKSIWQHWGVPLPMMDRAIRETLPGVPQDQRIELSARLWREPVWDLKIVAGRILAHKTTPVTGQIWQFVLERMPELDG